LGESVKYVLNLLDIQGNILLDPQAAWEDNSFSLLVMFQSDTFKERRYVDHISAYFDESGTHSNSRVLTVAGYLSLESEWIQFSKEWRNILSEFNIDAFHMTDWVSHTRHFKKWTDDQRWECYRRLTDTINRYALLGVGTCLPLDRYELVFKAKGGRFPGVAYGMAATGCFLAVADMLRDLGMDGKVTYIFGNGAQGKGKILQGFNANFKDRESRDEFRLGSLSFMWIKEQLPLQAADILAHELYRVLPRYLGVAARSTRKELDLLFNVPHRWDYFDDELFAKWSVIWRESVWK
jgi:hypothetical protein